MSFETAARTGAASSCGKARRLVCSEVDVPLDRTGEVAGTIPLHVEVLPSTEQAPRGVIFLVAGGPGQGSAHTFDLGTAASVDLYRLLFPGYTLVAYDDRGTGGSGVLRCPTLQNAVSSDDALRLVGDCAAALGPQRAFYSTADHAEDLEAVRQALGFDRIAIWGVSYGTKLALTYASAHPEHVERLLLDSVVAPDRPDPFGADMLQAMPATLAAYCPGGTCRAATPDFAGDIVALANRLAANPLQGTVHEPNGTTKVERVSAADFLGMVVDADLNPGLAAALPAAVRAAQAGNPQPLLHTFQVGSFAANVSAADMSVALYLATVCRDGPFPWLPDTPIADRPALAQAAIAALPAGSFGPFGSWAAGLAAVNVCLDWPSPAGFAAGAAPLPDVPVLAVSGGLDMRTPTAGAAAVVAHFPHGRLLVVPGVGHSVLTADPSGCSQRAVRNWILGGTPPATCARPKPYLTPLASFPAVASKRLDALQTREVAAKTVREAEAVWLMTVGSSRRAALPGMYGGRMLATRDSFTLERYGIAPGVSLTGQITLEKVGPPLAFKGFVIVEGKSAAFGLLKLSGGSLRGRLGGKVVGG